MQRIGMMIAAAVCSVVFALFVGIMMLLQLEAVDLMPMRVEDLI